MRFAPEPGLAGVPYMGGVAGTYRRPIVVGVDGTDAGRLAVEWAVGEARLRGSPVRIVTAFQPTSLAGAAPVPLQRRFDDAVAYAHDRLDAADVDAELVAGHPSRVLLAEARTAQLVVLGRRSGRLTGALTVERVTSWVAAHAACSVAVVRQDPMDGYPDRIVVGFDGSRSAAAALDAGLEEAELTGAVLDVVCCWQPGDYDSSERESAVATAELRRRQLEWFRDAVGERARKHRGVYTTRHLVERSPAQELVERSRHAGLLVVGSRGRGASAGLLLGSVSQSLLRHSHCTLIVARGDGDG